MLRIMVIGFEYWIDANVSDDGQGINVRKSADRTERFGKGGGHRPITIDQSRQVAHLPNGSTVGPSKRVLNCL